MAQNAKNVGTAKPNKGGAVWFALATDNPVLPTNASDALTGFKAIGYVSDDGISSENTRESEDILAFGGDIIASPQTETGASVTFTVAEYFSEAALELVYGADHVQKDESGNVTGVSFNSAELPRIVLVLEIVSGNKLVRTVYADAKVSETGELTREDGGILSQEVTVKAVPDEDGNYFVEYHSPKA